MVVIRGFYAAIIALCGVAASTANDNESINALYRHMTDAYERHDAESLSEIYADDGVFVHGYESVALIGIDAIVDYFDRFLGDLRKEGESLRISFRLSKRVCERTICADTGWYRLVRSDESRNAHVSYGKFFTTPMRSVEGSWRISLDVDGSAERQQWLSAMPIAGLHFDE